MDFSKPMYCRKIAEIMGLHGDVCGLATLG